MVKVADKVLHRIFSSPRSGPWGQQSDDKIYVTVLLPENGSRELVAQINNYSRGGEGGGGGCPNHSSLFIVIIIFFFLLKS